MPTAAAPTHYDLFPQTFPAGPPPASDFSPDLRALRKEFLQLQGKAHPDLAASGSKAHAEALSARINEAYKTLQDPLRRARYLLSLQGIDMEDESAKLAEADADLLMTVMEAREAVDEAASEAELHEVKSENDVRIEESVERLERLFAEEHWDEAAVEAVKLRYWMNVQESIAGWEHGKGGGNLQH